MTEPGGPTKGPQAFRTIGEAAELVGVPAHVLRFWETKFSSLRPLKRGGGRRYYRPRDLALLLQIKQLLHDQGFTIKGAQKALRDSTVPAKAGTKSDAAAAGSDGAPKAESDPIRTLQAELRGLAAECAAIAAGGSVPNAKD